MEAWRDNSIKMDVYTVLNEHINTVECICPLFIQSYFKIEIKKYDNAEKQHPHFAIWRVRALSAQ